MQINSRIDVVTEQDIDNAKQLCMANLHTNSTTDCSEVNMDPTPLSMKYLISLHLNLTIPCHNQK
jgi:hypothetical protein